jgi:FO synthase subunit 2
MMYGHLETPRQSARHLLLLRDLQRQTGGFSEFVPLGFIHWQAPMHLEGRFPALRPGPTGLATLRIHAVSRLVLNRDIPNIQVSWVKEGIKLAQACLAAGANDLGGTLINESISTAAGAEHGQLLRPADLRRFIQDAGRTPVERSTLYRVLRRFDSHGNTDSQPLDDLAPEDVANLGSYAALIESEKFSYSGRPRREALNRKPHLS